MTQYEQLRMAVSRRSFLGTVGRGVGAVALAAMLNLPRRGRPAQFQQRRIKLPTSAILV